MNQKDLQRLGRRDLLELLLELSKDNEQLRERKRKLEQQLADPMLTIANTGSIAEAALQLNSMFQAAQAACDQYIYNVQLRCRQAEENTHNNHIHIGNKSEY